MPDKSDLIARIEASNDARRKLMIEAIEATGVTDADRFIDKAIPQSTLFMIDIIPYIHRLYEHLPEGVWKSALDVGPENFGGTNLLASTHAAGTFCRLKLNVTAVDIVDRFSILRRLVAPGVEFLKQDIFEIDDRKWDFVIASHVIEHVPNPLKFVRRLQVLANDFVIIAAPWQESPLKTPGHINTISKSLVRQMGARNLTIFTNYTWGKEREVCLFWLPAGKQEGDG
ncbi:MAG: methyltransferase domain-containing protein [Parvularculaceae bacterium]